MHPHTYTGTHIYHRHTHYTHTDPPTFLAVDLLLLRVCYNILKYLFRSIKDLELIQ